MMCKCYGMAKRESLVSVFVCVFIQVWYVYMCAFFMCVQLQEKCSFECHIFNIETEFE